MKAVCRHCLVYTECVEIGPYFLCDEHKDLKQYRQKDAKKKQKPKPKKPISNINKKTGKPYQLKKTPIKRPRGSVNKISRQERRNIAAKKKTYQMIAESRPHICTGCGCRQNLTHSHLIPVGQNKMLESVPSNITYHCISCHEIWEHDLKGRKSLLDYHKNMEIIKVLDPNYYNLITAKNE